MSLALLLFVVFSLLGLVFGWLSFFRLSKMQSELDNLKRTLAALERRSTADDATRAEITGSDAAPSHATHSHSTPSDPTPSDTTSSQVSPDSGWTTARPDAGWSTSVESVPATTVAVKHRRNVSVQDWMVWIGGFCLAIAGVFMVRYSMDSGLLSPRVRVVLGFITGLLLHAAAEYLRRKHNRPVASLAALAGGGSAFLFAALLAALHLYDLLPASIAFLLLAVVSLATMFLSLVQGPVLAVMGMLGAYAVPVLVGSDGGSITAILIYSTIITSSCFLLMMRVYRHWLWFGTLLGALGWWLISTTMGDMTVLQHVYLLGLACACLLLFASGWLAADGGQATPAGLDALQPLPVLQTFTCILLAYALSLAGEAGNWPGILLTLPMIALFVVAVRRYPALERPVLLLQPLHLLFWLFSAPVNSLAAGDMAPDLNTLLYALTMTVVFVALSVQGLRRPGRWQYWLELVLVTPFSWFLVARFVTTGLEWSALWGIWTAVVCMIYLALGLALRVQPARWQMFGAPLLLRRAADGMFVIALVAYTLAAADIFDRTSLTLVIAAELILIAGLYRYFPSAHLHNSLKLVVALVLASVMFSPLIFDYSTAGHWTVTGMHGPTLCALLALLWLRKADNEGALPLQRWMELATLHLLVLSLWAELRYWLYDGDVLTAELGIVEMSLNMTLWAALALVYYLRASASQSLVRYYQGVSGLLLAMSAISYMFVVLPLNPLLNADAVISTLPVFNLLLLSYGMPALIMLVLSRYYAPRFRHVFAGCAALAAFIFLTMEVRHLWQPLMLLTHGISEGELYTYSALWLVIAVAAVVLGGTRLGSTVYNAGLTLLIIVIGKVFLVDTSGLEGLWRVMSYMLLGLCLLGLAYAHQRFNLGRKSSPGQSLPGSAGGD